MTEEKKPEAEVVVKEPANPDDKRVQIRDVTTEGANKDKELRFTKRIYVTYTNEAGEVLEGEFTIKRPTIGDQSRIGVIMAEMREDKPPNSLDAYTFNLHEWIATCRVTITASPPWWNTEDLFDDAPLRRVFQEVRAFVASFRKPSVEKRP